LAGVLVIGTASSEGLTASRLGVLYNLDDALSRQVAMLYAIQRAVPSENVIGVHLPNVAAMTPDDFAPVRAAALDRLPTQVQSLLLVWSKPYAVGCMSITSAFAAGYRPAFCQPGCARTPSNPLYDGDGWLPADTVGWWPAMLMPSSDPSLARALIQRGMAADNSAPVGTLYLIRTPDEARNVRADTYDDVQMRLEHRVQTVRLSAPVLHDVPDAIGYFTGIARVAELPLIHFRAGAIADHLTSSGGVLEGGHQMSALAWIQAGATATYGSVSEPCNFLGKFPDVNVLFEHYSRGETVLEAYWKSVAMPGQGLFIGEPLARPFAQHRQ
jgi:uncharacterized protein (TIGR03790 family)